MFEVAHAAGIAGSSVSGTLVAFWMALIFGVLVFLLMRAVMLWYWKIDKIVGLLERIEKNTRTNISTAVPVSGSEAEEVKSELKDGGLKASLNKKIF
jgi:hypothetical protein